MSNAPLAMSARLTTATNRARYLMNSRLRTIEALDAGSLTLFAVLRVLLPRCSDGALILAFQHFSPAQAGQRGLNSWRKERESAASFDHLVGTTEKCRGHSKAYRLGRLHIDDKFEPRRLLDRQIGWFGAF